MTAAWVRDPEHLRLSRNPNHDCLECGRSVKHGAKHRRGCPCSGGRCVVVIGTGATDDWFPTCGGIAVGLRDEWPMCQQHYELFGPTP